MDWEITGWNVFGMIVLLLFLLIFVIAVLVAVVYSIIQGNKARRSERDSNSMRPDVS